MPERDPRPAALPREREGLPSNYRMRADEHYVDQLAGGSDIVHASLDESATDSPDDELPADSADDRLFELLAAEVAAIEHSTTLLTERSPGLSQRVAADLIRAQSNRAAWLLGTRSVMDGTGGHDPRPQPVGRLLARVRERLAPECRLAGVSLQAHASDWQATVTVDEASVIAGLTGAVLATLGLVGESEGAVIRMTAVTLGGDLKTVEVRQDSVPVGGRSRRRFFDPDWTSRPGGALSAIAAEVSAVAARRHGGDALFLVRGRRGSTVRLNFSRRG